MKTQMRKAQGGDAVEAMAKLTVADKGESSAEGEAKDQPSSVCRVETRERRAVLCVCRVERDERSAVPTRERREQVSGMSSVRRSYGLGVVAFLGASEGINGVIFILRFYKYETIKKYGVYNFPEWGNHIISLASEEWHE